MSHSSLDPRFSGLPDLDVLQRLLQSGAMLEVITRPHRYAGHYQDAIVLRGAANIPPVTGLLPPTGFLAWLTRTTQLRQTPEADMFNSRKSRSQLSHVMEWVRDQHSIPGFFATMRGCGSTSSDGGLRRLGGMRGARNTVRGEIRSWGRRFEILSTGPVAGRIRIRGVPDFNRRHVSCTEATSKGACGLKFRDSSQERDCCGALHLETRNSKQENESAAARPVRWVPSE